ncbi:MAG TPA: YciI family protein [Chloroflexota bacterium]
MKKYVLVYESADDVLSKAPLHFQAHVARWNGYRENGSLLMIGTFADPREGAMAIFTSREAAEEFANGDPFVLNGVVRNWYIREWNEAIAEP